LVYAHPELTGEPDNDFLELTWEDECECGVRFTEGDNKIVKIKDNTLLLKGVMWPDEDDRLEDIFLTVLVVDEIEDNV
jgi:hypothetical protein